MGKSTPTPKLVDTDKTYMIPLTLSANLDHTVPCRCKVRYADSFGRFVTAIPLERNPERFETHTFNQEYFKYLLETGYIAEVEDTAATASTNAPAVE